MRDCQNENAIGVVARIQGVGVLPALDDAGEEIGPWSRRPGVDKAAPGVDEVLGVDRLPVGVARVAAQVERVGEAVARGRVRLGGRRLDITLVGRLVTVVLNGKRIISEQEIPGPTGGALDSKEGTAGPIMLQGDHGPVEYRNLLITPAR